MTLLELIESMNPPPVIVEPQCRLRGIMASNQANSIAAHKRIDAWLAEHAGEKINANVIVKSTGCSHALIKEKLRMAETAGGAERITPPPGKRGEWYKIGRTA